MVENGIWPNSFQFNFHSNAISIGWKLNYTGLKKRRWVNPMCANLVTWQIFQREDATTLLIIESESSVLYLFCGKPPNCQCHLSSSTLSSAFWSHDREIDWFWAKHIEDFVLYYTTNFTDLKDADIGAHGPMGIHSKWKNIQPFKKVN